MLGSLMWVLCKYFEKEGGGCVFASTEEDKGGLTLWIYPQALARFGIMLQVVCVYTTLSLRMRTFFFEKQNENI